MHVLATAGHVDHGKSTLVRALTGMEPDRWAEERRRGMTIDLGFVWTPNDAPWLPAGERIAFVDVPGHERFVKNMLAGVGPVPAVLFVVAADDGWKPQSEEHLRALDALHVRHGVVALTRADLAEPERVAEVRDVVQLRLGDSSLGPLRPVVVSARTGEGLDELRRALAALTARLRPPEPDADVRLWVDRAFSVTGAGMVVTATLGAGGLQVGAELEVARTGARMRVRALQSLGAEVTEARPVSRIAVNVRGPGAAQLARGDVLVEPRRWLTTSQLDLRVRADTTGLPRELTLHVGSTAQPAGVRRLGADTVRLTFETALPLRPGDRVLLRDAGRHQVVGGRVLDVRPPTLGRRGAAAARAAELARVPESPDLANELARRGVAPADELRAMGFAIDDVTLVHGWAVHPPVWEQVRARLVAMVAEQAAAHDLRTGLTVESARRLLDLPDERLVLALAEGCTGLLVRAGRVLTTDGPDDPARLPGAVRVGVAQAAQELADHPFRAPEMAQWRELGLDRPHLAGAVRAGLLLRLADGVYLLPGADDDASERLARLPQPFTTSAARQALDTTRRVVVPLLEHLDRAGRTERVDDNRRRVLASSPRAGDQPGVKRTGPAGVPE